MEFNDFIKGKESQYTKKQLSFMRACWFIGTNSGTYGPDAAPADEETAELGKQMLIIASRKAYEEKLESEAKERARQKQLLRPLAEKVYQLFPPDQPA